MIRTTYLMLVLFTIFGLSIIACGSSSSSSDTSTTDTTAPVITITGDNLLSVSKDSTYTEQGATATDAVDGTVTVSTSGSVDTSMVGSYTITYTATDVANNTATATRTVTVSISTDCTDITPTFQYRLVDTNQTLCYNSSTGASTTCTDTGQDGEFTENTPSYSTCEDGKVVIDNITGLMWQSTTDTDGVDGLGNSDKKTQAEADTYCTDLDYGNNTDWRLPSTKELYSIYLMSGEDISGVSGASTNGTAVDVTGYEAFLNTSYFDVGYGDTDNSERKIDGQYATSTLNLSQVMSGISETLVDAFFGVNFVDGHLKSYGKEVTNTNDANYYVRCVRGNSDYGTNSFTNNADGVTVTDSATNLIWEKDDHTSSNFEDALSSCNSATTGSLNDWRLPNIKELHSIVDYTRSPEATSSPSIDTDYFNSTSFTNEAGQEDWGYYWSSSALLNYTGGGSQGAYITFGRGLGYINEIIDVHGAGAQRSDYKTVAGRDADNVTEITADASATFGTTAYKKGPQGDIIRVEHNYVRCVRDND